MRISEIFYSIQGEGTFTGMPSVFIRAAGCNLRCRWCDSKYAARPAQGKELTVNEIIKKAARYQTKFYVLTGGEPMMAKGIYELAQRLVDGRKHVTIETAATIPPGGIACSLASLSPKLSNSTPGRDVASAVRRRHETKRLQLNVIRDWIDHYDYQLKFVICSSADIDELIALLGGLERTIPPEKVLLMPEGVNTRAVGKVSDVVVAACKEHGFRFCDRLHIRLFGNTRGR
jgi:7-carboxy-7-deazaguanine synthase